MSRNYLGPPFFGASSVFCPLNGPGTIHAGSERQLRAQGRHQADWEHVTVRVSNVTPVGKLLGVFLSQHGDQVWVPWTEDRPIDVFASQNGHAMYVDEGDNVGHEVSRYVRRGGKTGGSRAGREVRGAASMLVPLQARRTRLCGLLVTHSPNAVCQRTL